MNKALLCLLAAALPLFSQAVRVDPTPVMKTAGNVGPGGYPQLLAVPGPQVSVCSYPANGVPCTNYATTYSDSSATTQCPTNAQVTVAASNVCAAFGDTKGNFGFWVAEGTYAYTVSYAGQTFGPYPFTASRSGVTFPSGILVGNGTATVTALNINTVPQNVQNHGATGNGTTDDTTAINATITAVCASGNRAMYFPQGNYIVSASLTIPCSMTIYGDGQVAATITGKAGSMIGGNFIVTAANVSFRSLTIDGNAANLGCGLRMTQWASGNTYAKYNGVLDAATSKTYIALQAVPGGTAISNTAYWLPVLTALTSAQLTQILSPGLGIEFRADNGSVSDVEIKNESNWGVTVNAQTAPGSNIKHILLQNSSIHDIGVPAQGNTADQAGFQDYNGTLTDLRILNNRFENIYSPTYGPGFTSGVFTPFVSDKQIIGNTFVNCLNQQGGVIAQDSTSLPYPNNGLIKNNIVRQTVYLNGDESYCIEEEGVNHLVIDGNICIGLAFGGLTTGGLVSGTQNSELVVTNNYFNVVPTLHPGTYVNAIGFPSNSTTGGVNFAVVSNNIVNGSSLAGYGFYIPTTSTGIFGRGNKILNTTVGALQDLSGAANILMEDANAWTGGTTATVSNTTTLTKMYAAGAGTVPLGMLNYTGATVDIKGGGIYSSIASPGNVTFNLYLGSSQVCSFGTPPIPASSTALSYTFSAQLFFNVNTVVCNNGTLYLNGASGATSVAMVSETTTPISPNNAYTVDVGVQMSVANAGNSFTGKQMSWTVNYPGSKSLP